MVPHAIDARNYFQKNIQIVANQKIKIAWLLFTNVHITSYLQANEHCLRLRNCRKLSWRNRPSALLRPQQSVSLSLSLSLSSL
jgi:hypothetical protein